MDSDVRLSRDLGFLRVALAVPQLRIGDVDFNFEAIVAAMARARGLGVQVLAFPEMALTGYTIADLVQHRALLSKVRDGLCRLLKESARNGMVILVGAPLEVEEKIYNCAVVMNSGRILGVIPKTLLPTYKEFYEERWFASAASARTDSVDVAGQQVPFGTDVLIRLKGIDGAVIGVEICEDLWMPLSPHAYQALAGAAILINISASNEIIAKADWRRTMVTSESGRCVAAYCYLSSGVGESSNDVVYGGHSLIAENGVVLKESARLRAGLQMTITDIDLDRLVHDRRVLDSFRDAWGAVPPYRVLEAAVADPVPGELQRTLDPHPFVPADPSRRAERCRDIFSMQVAALGQKLSGAGLSRVVLGVSGGLDSTRLRDHE
jgi:NAD+ synthase (glutamine-hydrolysing)